MGENMNEVIELIPQKLLEAWGDIIDPRGPVGDTPGFGWLSKRLGYYTMPYDRAEGRYAPIYDNELDLRAIRLAAWLMDAEVPVAKAMKARLADYTIASGFDWTIKHSNSRVQAICKTIVERWLQDADWATVERESFEREIVDGEFLAEIVVDGKDIGLEILEGDHLTEPASSQELDRWLDLDIPSCWTFGVLTQERRSKPLGYHIVRDGVGTDWDFIKPERFIHWKRNVSKNAKRGASDHYTTHKYLKYADQVCARTAQGVAIQASIAYIVEHAARTSTATAQNIAANRPNIVVGRDPATGEATQSRKIAPGQVVDIPNGAKYHAALLGSNASTIYIDVMESLFRLSGTVYAFPENFVTGYAGNNNMASAIEAKTPFVQGRFADQRTRSERLRELLHKVIKLGLSRMATLGLTYEEVEPGLEISIAAPDIVTKDPDAIVESLIKMREKRWISDRGAIQKLGGDYDDVQAQLAEEDKLGATGVDPSRSDELLADGEQNEATMSGMGRRAFKNNRKAIADILADYNSKAIGYSEASVLLKAIGLKQASVDSLLGQTDEALRESVIAAEDGEEIAEEDSTPEIGDAEITRTQEALQRRWSDYP